MYRIHLAQETQVRKKKKKKQKQELNMSLHCVKVQRQRKTLQTAEETYKEPNSTQEIRACLKSGR